MRRPVDEKRLRSLFHALGREAEQDTRLYLTGGATAVLEGWRSSTIDVDVKIVPESDSLLRAIPRLKDELEINVELAAPDQFIPELPGWQERSPFIERAGLVSFHHYDLYAQALAKIERGHEKDLQDVRAMLDRGLIEASRLPGFFDAIVPGLYRYPALDEKSYRRALKDYLDSQ
jgi:hypothetical protein